LSGQASPTSRRGESPLPCGYRPLPSSSASRASPFGALHQMLAGLSEAEREEAWSEIERELSRYETAGGFEGPCELLVAAGTAPT
jgi:hypothetical protein